MSKEQGAHRGTLKRLIKELVRGNELHLAVVFVCIVIVAVANASMALFVKTLIDNYILPLVGQANPDFGPLAQILGVMATIYALGVLSSCATTCSSICRSCQSASSIRISMATS